MVILDPNSDYVGLAEVRDGADPTTAARYRRRSRTTWPCGATSPVADQPLRLRFAELDARSPGSSLGLDPIRDRDEYAVLTDLLRAQRTAEPLITGLDAALGRPRHPGPASSAMRASQPGRARTGRSGARQSRRSSRSCAAHQPLHRRRPGLAGHLRGAAPGGARPCWRRCGRRGRRAEPCLVVIDEAHNICPAEPPDAVSRLVDGPGGPDRRRGTQVRALPADLDAAPPQGARERRVPVRQPAADADELAGRPGRPEQAVLLRAAGPDGRRDLVPDGPGAGRRQDSPATRVRADGRRVSQEGGADVPTTWAAARASS